MGYVNDFPDLTRTLGGREVTGGTRYARMLEAGDVRVTITSKATEKHITVRFKAYKKNESSKWARVPLREATHVFVEVPPADRGVNALFGADKIGTYYPERNSFYRDDKCSDARYWAARNAALWLIQDNPSKQATYLEENRCGVCARPLTDPVSIRRGIGPTCYGQETGSQHEVKVKEEQMSLEGDFLEGLDYEDPGFTPPKEFWDEPTPAKRGRLERQSLRR